MANFNWQKLLNKSWTYTKVFFAVLTLMVGSYFYGTYYPNKSAIAEVNAELDVFYMNKIKEMDLQEPEFTYINETQFIRAMHKCINYINFNKVLDLNSKNEKSLFSIIHLYSNSSNITRLFNFKKIM